MKCLNEFLREFFVLLFEGLQVSPLVRVQEIEEVEQFSDVVVQRRLKISKWVIKNRLQVRQTYSCHDDTVNRVEFRELLEDQAAITLD